MQCGIEHHLPAVAGSSTTVILEMFSCRLTPCLLLHQLNPHCMLPNCTTACNHCRLTHHPWHCVQNATWATRLHELAWHSGASACRRQRRFIAARLISDIWQHDEKQHYGLRNIGEFVGPSGCRYVRRDIQFSLYMEQVSQPA